MRLSLKILLGVVAGGAAAVMAGCTIPVTIPYRRTVPEGATLPGQTVVVALTSTEFEKPQRRQFFNRTQEVMKDMSNHDGLIGYSVRFQLLGTRAWTMSVWRDEASMKRFVAARVHRHAMREGDDLLKSVHSVVVAVPAEKVPLRWSEALQIVDGTAKR